jgi:hypothetical protein
MRQKDGYLQKIMYWKGRLENAKTEQEQERAMNSLKYFIGRRYPDDEVHAALMYNATLDVVAQNKRMRVERIEVSPGVFMFAI